jgi:hypothetical protein
MMTAMVRRLPLLLLALLVPAWGCSKPQTVVYSANEAEIPAEVPAGETPWMNGRFTFEDAKGDVVLVSAWDPSCKICLASVPAIHALDDTYRARGLRIFTVTEVDPDDRDEDREYAEGMAMKHGIKYSTLFDDDGHWMRQVGIDDTPTFLVVDRDGRVILLHQGRLDKNGGAYRTIEETIDGALGRAKDKD